MKGNKKERGGAQGWAALPKATVSRKRNGMSKSRKDARFAAARGFCVLALAAVFALAGCASGDPGDDDGDEVIDVSVYPGQRTIYKGDSDTFSANVRVSGNLPQTVTWSVEGGVQGTAITQEGALTVSASETAETLTVRATSTADTSKSGTATVTVSAVPLPYLEGTVTITGTPVVGGTLTADVSLLEGEGTISYQWCRINNGFDTPIEGATAAAYTPVEADLNKYIEVKVERNGYRGCQYGTIQIESFVPVTDIVLAAASTIAGTPLTLTAVAVPKNATNKTITWSGAGVSGAVFTSQSAGTVTITASIADGTTINTPYTKDFTITVITEDAANTADFGAGASIQTPITVTSAGEWAAALAAIIDGGDDKNYIIKVNTEVTGLTGVQESNAYSFGSATGVTVSLRGAGSLKLGYYGSLLKIKDQQTLILRGVSLVQKTDNYADLVYIDGTSGTTNPPVFKMEGGDITGGDINGSQYALVKNDYGTFTMSGGTISNVGYGYNNYGVYNRYDGTFTMENGIINGTVSSDGTVIRGGTFTMEDGTINGTVENNYGSNFTMAGGTISGYGRGVYSSSTFTMEGGTISGSNVGVYNNGGTFTMTGGTIKGNTAIGGENKGGGVYIVYNSSGSNFTKTGGIIYGKNEGANSNTALAGDTNGHAVFVSGGGYGPDTYRDTTAGSDVHLTVTNGSATGAGWNQ